MKIIVSKCGPVSDIPVNLRINNLNAVFVRIPQEFL